MRSVPINLLPAEVQAWCRELVASRTGLNAAYADARIWSESGQGRKGNRTAEIFGSLDAGEATYGSDQARLSPLIFGAIRDQGLPLDTAIDCGSCLIAADRNGLALILTKPMTAVGVAERRETETSRLAIPEPQPAIPVQREPAPSAGNRNAKPSPV